MFSVYIFVIIFYEFLYNELLKKENTNQRIFNTLLNITKIILVMMSMSTNVTLVKI